MASEEVKHVVEIANKELAILILHVKGMSTNKNLK